MNQEIKQRLEMIQKGEVPEGYKQTKIGIIPNDWKVEKFGNVCKDKGQYGAGESALPYSKDLPTYLRITDIDENGRIIKNNLMSVKLEDKKKYLLKENDLLFARTGGTTGKTYLYSKNDGDLYFAGFLIRFKINHDVTNPYFIKLYTETYQYDKWVKIMSMRGGQPGINSEEYSSMRLPTPSLPEQTVIAEILSNQDNLIELKEKLLEEKKNLKKSLMQNLLSGKVRFKEFNDEWKEVKLKKLLKEILNRNKENQVKRVLSVTNKKGFVNQDEYFGKEIASKDISNYKIVSRGEFAYNPSRINVGSIDLLTSFENGILSPMYVIFKTKDNLNPIYFRYWLDTHQFKGRIESFVAGSVRDSLAFKDMSMMKILLPSLPEQEKIANTLQNQDKEISLLQEEINQLKLQKKSLMQLLLTGIVRVSQNVIPSKVINCGLKMEVEQ